MHREAGWRVVAVLCLLACGPPASAVVLYSGSERNTNPPGSLANHGGWSGAGEDDPRRLLDNNFATGWDYQGEFAGIYMGTAIDETHFITAVHVGTAGNQFKYKNSLGQIVTHSVSSYTDIPGTDLRIGTISSGQFDHYAELWDPIADGAELGKSMMVFGRGLNRGAAVQVGGTVKGWEIANGTSGEWTWGENTVNGLWDYAQNGDDKLLGFSMDPGAGMNEAGLSYFDSSGGVFIRGANGNWKLAGINYGAFLNWRYDDNGSPGAAFQGTVFDPVGLWVVLGNDVEYVDENHPDLAQFRSYFSSRISSSYTQIITAIGGVPLPAPAPEPGGMALILLFMGATFRRASR